MNQKNLEKLYIKIMCELYKASSPSADFMKLAIKHKGDRTDWFKSYYLDKDEFDEIYGRNIKGKRLNTHDKLSLGMAVYLECSPTSDKEK